MATILYTSGTTGRPKVYRTCSMCSHTVMHVSLTRRYTQGLQCICVRILVYMCPSHGNTPQGVVLSHGNLLHQMLDNSYSGVAAVRSYTPLLHASRYAPFTRLFDLKGCLSSAGTMLGRCAALHTAITCLYYTTLLHASLTHLVCTPLLHASVVFSWNHARATCSSAYCRAGTFSSALLSTMRSSEVTRLFYTPLLHTRLFCTPLLHASLTRLFYTPLLRCDACLLLCQDLQKRPGPLPAAGTHRSATALRDRAPRSYAEVRRR